MKTNSIKSPFSPRIFSRFIPFSAVTNPPGKIAKWAGLQQPQKPSGPDPDSPKKSKSVPSIFLLSILFFPVFATYRKLSLLSATSKYGLGIIEL